MRLAVYGYLAEEGGSLGSAHHLVLDRLLTDGHRIDLYAIEGFVAPGRLAEHPNLTYLPVRHGPSVAVWRLIERLKGRRMHRPLSTAFSLPSNRLHYPVIEDVLRRRHRRERYDALLVLGLLSPWKLPGLRTVSWTQGTPNGEWGWVQENWLSVARRAGPLHLPGLAGVYATKYLEALADHRKSDVVLCGSRWAVGSWRRFGVPRRKLTPLPYPIDLDRFRPAPPPADKPPGEFLFLHLGRVVPRKRLDLLLDAFALFAREEPAARLWVVGGLSYGTRGDRRRLAEATQTGAVVYKERVPRAEVPGLLARTDCVVQPSENENFGSAVAESQASGRPVLLGPTNGTKDYVAASSVVFDRYTPAAVADGMREVVRRVRADRAGVAADSRAAAERNLSVARVATELERVLQGK
jgi:glycosyltransferase involved in cell wall biosynthesis